MFPYFTPNNNYLKIYISIQSTVVKRSWLCISTILNDCKLHSFSRGDSLNGVNIWQPTQIFIRSKDSSSKNIDRIRQRRAWIPKKLYGTVPMTRSQEILVMICTWLMWKNDRSFLIKGENRDAYKILQNIQCRSLMYTAASMLWRCHWTSLPIAYYVLLYCWCFLSFLSY